MLQYQMFLSSGSCVPMRITVGVCLFWMGMNAIDQQQTVVNCTVAAEKLNGD